MFLIVFCLAVLLLFPLPTVILLCKFDFKPNPKRPKLHRQYWAQPHQADDLQTIIWCNLGAVFVPVLWPWALWQAITASSCPADLQAKFHKPCVFVFLETVNAE